jgi:hypothetical protein
MINLNLVHNVPGTFTVQSERLALNDGVNFSLMRNPFVRQIAKPTFNKTYDEVEETIVLNVTGETYADVQNNLDLLIEKLERVARFNAGEHNGGLMLEVLISGTSTITANSAYTARIMDYELTLPEDEMQYRNLRVIKGVQLMIKRGPFYDAYAYANIPNSNVYTGTTAKVPGIITFSGILPIKNSSAVQLKIGDFSQGIKTAMPEIFYVATNSSANAIYDLTGSGTGITTISGATARGGSYVQLTISGGTTVPLTQDTTLASGEYLYPYDSDAKSTMVFATLTVSGTAAIKAGIELQENNKRFLTSPTFVTDITNPQVVYLGQLETLGTLNGVVCLEATAYNDAAVVSVDTLTFVANDSMYTQVFKVLPSTPPTTTSAMFAVDPVLGAYGPTSQFLNTDFRSKVVYSDASQSLKLGFQFGSALDFLPVVGTDCISYKTETSFNDATVNNNMYLIVLATGDDGNWTLQKDAGGDYDMSADIAVIPAYPYLPRI